MFESSDKNDGKIGKIMTNSTHQQTFSVTTATGQENTKNQPFLTFCDAFPAVFSTSQNSLLSLLSLLSFIYKWQSIRDMDSSTHFYYLYKKCVESVDKTQQTQHTLNTLSTDSIKKIDRFSGAYGKTSKKGG
jgi:hypothetical protein